MKIKYIIVGAIAMALALVTVKVAQSESKPIPAAPVTIPAPRFTHQQEVWMNALEWCESNAINTSVNWYDRDGTASYYAFQFKPGTLREYGEKYGVIQKGKTAAEIMVLLKDYTIQRAIVEYMVEDPHTDWRHQFPDCSRKLGTPPRKKITN
jgi:hypothetical protein